MKLKANLNKSINLFLIVFSLLNFGVDQKSAFGAKHLPKLFSIAMKSICSYESLDYQEQSNFVMFSDIKGLPLMENIRGSTEKEIVFVQPNEKGIQITLIDSSCYEAYRVIDENASGADVIRFINIGNNNRLLVATSTELSVYKFDLDTVSIYRYNLPSKMILMECGAFGAGKDESIALVGEDGLYVGIFEEQRIVWQNVKIPPSIFSRLYKFHSTHYWLKEVADRCRFVLDINEDGLDDILLPDVSCVNIILQKYVSKFATHTVNISSNLFRTTCATRFVSKRSQQIIHDAKDIIPYDIAFVPKQNTFTQVGTYLLGTNHHSKTTIHRIIRKDNQFLEAVLDDTAITDLCILNKDIINRADDWVVWTSHTFRLLWPHQIQEVGKIGYNSKWLIDINGDGIYDLLESKEILSMAGPKRKIFYTLGQQLPETQDKLKYSNNYYIKRDTLLPKKPTGTVTGIDWAGNSFITDLNGDGALDLIFLQLDADVKSIVSFANSSSLKKCQYTCWLFDKNINHFTPTNRFIFSTKQGLQFGKRRMSASPIARRFSPTYIDYGDINNDGCQDVVLSLSRKRLGICFNTKNNQKPLDITQTIELKTPPYERFAVFNSGIESGIISWDNGIYSVTLFRRR